VAFIPVRLLPEQFSAVLYRKFPLFFPSSSYQLQKPATIVQKGFGRGLGEPFPQKGSPNCNKTIFDSKTEKKHNG
jgi:hypothetical protein